MIVLRDELNFLHIAPQVTSAVLGKVSLRVLLTEATNVVFLAWDRIVIESYVLLHGREVTVPVSIHLVANNDFAAIRRVLCH